MNVYERMEKENTAEHIKEFMERQKMSYIEKKYYAVGRISDYLRECSKRGYNAHVSVGGLDSIVLYFFINYAPEMKPTRDAFESTFGKIKGISASYLEDSSIQKMHKALGIETVKPVADKNGKVYSKSSILQEFGFPVLSKEIAAKIELLQNPTEKNKTVRHAIITGETGEYGGWRKNSRMKLAKKWLDLFGGYANEIEGTNYGKPDFKVSSKCCYYLKEKPCDDWARKNHSVPFLGLMASEGGRREKSLKAHGCNYWGKTTVRSAPFAIFLRQDLLKLAVEMDELYKERREEIRNGRDIEMPESLIPEIYGEIVEENGVLRTTKAQRTGCTMCGFGIQLEKRPHRFDLLRERNQKEWEYWMYKCCIDEKGEKFGWGKVLDYIGVEWEKPPTA